MSYSRDEFIVRMTREGLLLDIARALLRSATTLHRLAEAQCNGDWPADNGERKVVSCVACEQSWVPSNLKRTAYMSAGISSRRTYYRLECQDCRLVRRLKALLPAGWAINVQGDPRGYVLRVIPPSYAERNTGKDRHNLDTIGVPTR